MAGMHGIVALFFPPLPDKTNAGPQKRSKGLSAAIVFCFLPVARAVEPLRVFVNCSYCSVFLFIY